MTAPLNPDNTEGGFAGVWQPIESASKKIIDEDVLLWNGVRVFPGWLGDDGWHDSRNRDHMDDAEDPQPTHWMPLPKPPVQSLTKTNP